MASIPRLMPSEKRRNHRFKTSHFNCVFFWIHYNGDNSFVLETLPASVLIWWSQIPVYLLRLRVASKLNLRLSNLQLIPANLQIQYCYLLSVTNPLSTLPRSFTRETSGLIYTSNKVWYSWYRTALWHCRW